MGREDSMDRPKNLVLERNSYDLLACTIGFVFSVPVANEVSLA